MTLVSFGSWQGSPLWVAAGEAMLDFLISGAAAGVASASRTMAEGVVG